MTDQTQPATRAAYCGHRWDGTDLTHRCVDQPDHDGEHTCCCGAAATKVTEGADRD